MSTNVTVSYCQRPLAAKKPPQVFPGRCIKPYLIGDHEAGQFLHQRIQFFLAALADYTQGMGEIQTEQLHEALGLDLVVLIPDDDGKGVSSSDGNEILHVLDAA